MAATTKKSKHRKRSGSAKKFAAAGAATVTSAALTVGMAPPPPDTDRSVTIPVSLAASPNYTQIIENSSDSLNNLLYTQANFTNALGAVLNPLAALTGGVLPSVDADVDQVEVNSLASLVETLSLVLNAVGTVPNLGAIPGLPPNAATDLAAALNLPGDLGLGALAPLLLETAGVLAVVDGLLDVVAGNPLLSVPTLDDVIDALGLTVQTTSFTSSFLWPVLGIDGSSNVTNIFAQLDGLTGSALVAEILDQTTLLGQPLPAALRATIAGILTPLDVLETPSVTAWLPTATGNYTLPLGGSFGYLATMPTLAVGALDVLGIEVPETVVAVPLAGAGLTLPLGLASFGTVATPGVVFPTATGVSTLLGTNLQSFAMPLLGTSYTSLNTLNSTYFGTNGINYNSGQTVGLLTTPFGVLPIVYSLGRVNAGTTGFGFSGPSLFGVGLLPHLQVGTAPDQQSPDGVIPPLVLNAGLNVPTQLTSVTGVLNVPSPQLAIDALVNPVFNATAAPLGALITEFLNENIGSYADGSSNFALQVTNIIRELSEGLPGAAQLPADDEATADADILQPSTLAEPETTVAAADPGMKQAVTTDAAPNLPTASDDEGGEDLLDEGADLQNGDDGTKIPFGKAAKDALEQTDKNFKSARSELDRIAKDGRKQINDTVKGAQKGVHDTAKKVGTGIKRAGDDVKKALGGDKADDKDSKAGKDAKAAS
ncbi:hypothetical protein [Mycolicibacterium arseniciresistens]|uniref:ATPase AAA n=1 Tax=Mycolicibacterium arseniciresistens TaxID=3062257 RepID=A0ABT8UGS1_9MYCO|nr:hypothetical protein [Mycolicibacterium arseniciresistens]MDO3635593.1 hypothetical protein [Mycolicibacterium arseniciresistens]